MPSADQHLENHMIVSVLTRTRINQMNFKHHELPLSLFSQGTHWQTFREKLLLLHQAFDPARRTARAPWNDSFQSVLLDSIAFPAGQQAWLLVSNAIAAGQQHLEQCCAALYCWSAGLVAGQQRFLLLHSSNVQQRCSALIFSCWSASLILLVSNAFAAGQQ